MASLSQDGKIVFYADQKKKSFRVGRLNKKAAQSVLNKVETILSHRAGGDPLPEPIVKWLGSCDRWLVDTMAKAGLIDALPEDCSANDYFLRYIDKYKSKRGSSWRKNQDQARVKIQEHFESRSLREITPEDAQAFRDWLADHCAQATVSGYIKVTKKICRAAIKDGLIHQSPFVDVIAGSQANPNRLHYVSREDTQKLIDAAPNKNWRLLIALSRFGGLRNTSETFALKWSQVDWTLKTILVPGAKGKRTGEDTTEVRWRTIPIYPELNPYLEESFDPEQEFVIYGIEGTPSNTRSTLERIVAKAELTQWPRIWHNLRASRDTDLSEFLPEHVVGSLMGNTPKVSRKHYKMLTDEQLESLTLSPPLSPARPNSGDEAKVGIQVGTKVTETASLGGNEPQLIRLFPGIYMNPEEFENPKRPRQESNLRHQL